MLREELHWVYWKDTLHIQLWNDTPVLSLEHLPVEQLPRHSPLRREVWAGILLLPFLQSSGSGPGWELWEVQLKSIPTHVTNCAFDTSSVCVTSYKKKIGLEKEVKVGVYLNPLKKQQFLWRNFLLGNPLKSYSDCLLGYAQFFFSWWSVYRCCLNPLVARTLKVWKAWGSTSLLSWPHIDTYVYLRN